MPLKPKSPTPLGSPPPKRGLTVKDTRPGFLPRSHYDALLLRCAAAEDDLKDLIDLITMDPAFLRVEHANDWHAAARALLGTS